MEGIKIMILSLIFFLGLIIIGILSYLGMKASGL